MMYLIKTGDEVQCVQSLEGYEGCEVLEEGVAAPRHDCCERIEGRWSINRERAARQKLLSLGKLEIIEMYEARFRALEERLEALDGRKAGGL